MDERGTVSSLPGFDIHRYGEVASTNDIAFELAAAGRGEGTVVVADSQREGRGRQGRTWLSPPGGNLYFSLVLRPPREKREWPDLPWVIAGAVALEISRMGVSAVAVKNPNDVLAGGRKIAGVLLENRVGAGSPYAVIAGVGVNVGFLPGTLPGDLVERVTSLHDQLGRKIDREGLLLRLLRSIEEIYLVWTSRGGAAARRRLEEAGMVFENFDDGEKG